MVIESTLKIRLIVVDAAAGRVSEETCEMCLKRLSEKVFAPDRHKDRTVPVTGRLKHSEVEVLLWR